MSQRLVDQNTPPSLCLFTDYEIIQQIQYFSHLLIAEMSTPPQNEERFHRLLQLYRELEHRYLNQTFERPQRLSGRARVHIMLITE